jgi:hypothetical protein
VNLPGPYAPRIARSVIHVTGGSEGNRSQVCAGGRRPKSHSTSRPRASFSTERPAMKRFSYLADCPLLRERTAGIKHSTVQAFFGHNLQCFSL